MRIFTVVFLALSIGLASQAKEKKFLETYRGQTVEQLIALESDHRIDSLVLAFEQALQMKAEKKLSQVERDVLAIEAMEREVNNGGFHQFFLNDSKAYAGILPGALMRSGSPRAAEIATAALTILEITGEVSEAKVDRAMKQLGGNASAQFEKVDQRYFENKEAIADSLFAYIKANKAEIRLK